MTDERFEQLMKQALKPEIDGRDVVIQKNTNNYKNRMKRKRRLHVCITAGIAAAACVLSLIHIFIKYIFARTEIKLWQNMKGNGK